MSERIVTVVPGNRLVLETPSSSPDAAIEVYLERELLRIRERGRAIGRLEGDGFRERVTPACASPRWNWLRREAVREHEIVMLTTLPHLGSTCVYVAAEGGLLTLTGGASIVSRIETDDVARLLALRDDRVL